MACAADVRFSPLLERLIRADLDALVVNLAVRSLNLLTEHVVEAFVREIAFLHGYPLLEPKMRIDDERSIAHRAALRDTIAGPAMGRAIIGYSASG